MPDAFIGIGSNIEPAHNLRLAVEELTRRFRNVAASSVYRSRAFGFDGDDFLNMVVALETALPAAELESELSAIEYAGGRVRAASRFGPRTLDLDLLIYGASVDPAQRLPRDDVSGYAFVLGPLAEIAPELVHPITGRRIAELWERSAMQRTLTRVGAWLELDSRSGGLLPADAAAPVDG